MFALIRLFRGIAGAWHEASFRSVLFLVSVTLVSGTIFYHRVEHWSWVDAVYFCVATISTVGYGDLTPKTDLGKIFTCFYIVGGIGLFVAFVTFIANGVLREFSKKRTGRHDHPRA